MNPPHRSPVAIPRIASVILHMLLPKIDRDFLRDCYEKEYRERYAQQGKRKAWKWISQQILSALPVMLKMKITGEAIMIRNYIVTTFRNIRRHKGYAFINIAGLAVGMACCLLIFLWVNHERSYDRYHKNADDIFRVVCHWPGDEGEGWTWRTPPPMAPALKEKYPDIQESTRFYWRDGLLIEHGERGFREDIGFADSSLFQIFTIPLVKGNPRNILDDPKSVVISETTAQKFFGSEDPIGQTLVVDERMSFQVAGVMENIPSNSMLRYPVIVPFSQLEELAKMGALQNWGDFGYNTFVLLQENADLEAVKAKVRPFLDDVFDENTVDLELQLITRIHLYTLEGGGPIVYVWIFSGVAIFILIIACINFMNLATARSATRAREIGMRKVVGANRWRIIQQFMSESILMALVSLFFAIILVGLLARPLARLADLPEGSRLFDPQILPIFILIAVIAGLLAGSYPALFLSTFQPTAVLKGRQKTGSVLFRRILVIFQFAVSIFLLVGMMLMSRQIAHMDLQALGFSKEHVVYVPMNDSLKAKLDPMRQEILKNPGILSVAAVSNYLGQGAMWSTSGVEWEGSDPTDGAVSLSMIYVDEGLSETFDLKMAAGRFYAKDFETDPENFVLNEAAIKVMGMESPVGSRLRVAGQQGHIIGVVEDFNFRSLHSDISPLVLIMDPKYYRYLAVRITAADVPGILESIERVFKMFSPKQPFEYRFLDEVLDRSYRAEERSRILFEYAVLLAVFISCLGLFGLASFMAERRTKEIGVRKVLGASKSGIFLLIARNFLLWILVANIIAWPAAYYFMKKWLQNFAYRTPITLDVFIIAGFITIGLALLTVSWQSLKIARTDPIHALRWE
jgi:putative ABC transport system permease protein